MTPQPWGKKSRLIIEDRQSNVSLALIFKDPRAGGGTTAVYCRHRHRKLFLSSKAYVKSEFSLEDFPTGVLNRSKLLMGAKDWIITIAV